MSIGKITNALFSGTNENTVQLAGLNIDFAILKFEAPKEFQGLGAALSRLRRVDAEDGPLHQTARKLGALFEPILPSTPNLVKAYGTRASSIFESPVVNPQGTRRDGPFEAYVGADGTSLWAAATSGSASIAVHLLACMLARSWDAKVATSIWVEIILERKREVEEAVKGGSIMSMSLVMVVGQDISRDQIRLWDASARSWLQSADREKLSEQKRLDLILKNISIPVSGGSTTYVKVLSAWKGAMLGLENLLLGIPQQVCDGAILLALSSWHIFPDLLVLSRKTVNVPFNDPLVPKGGVITIGLQSSDQVPDKGMGWSLALSHLRYYGDPVPVAHDDIKGRVPMMELQVVALGALLRKWGIPPDPDNSLPVCRWLVTLWDLINKSPSDIRGRVCCDLDLKTHFCWLEVLVTAAKHVLCSKNQELETAIMLISYGFRRGRVFLGEQPESLVPFFGLCNRVILTSLAQPSNADIGIQYFREVAAGMGLSEGEAIITYSGEMNSNDYYEYATAIPHRVNNPVAGKRAIEGAIKEKYVHARWFGLQRTERSANNREKGRCNCKDQCRQHCPCSIRGGHCIRGCFCRVTRNSESSCSNFSTLFTERAADIVARGEVCFTTNCGLGEPVGFPSPPFIEWNDPPILYFRDHLSARFPCIDSNQLCSCYKRITPKDNYSAAKLRFYGITGKLGLGQHALWVRRGVSDTKSPQDTNQPRPTSPTYLPEGRQVFKQWDNPELLSEHLTQLNPNAVMVYLDRLHCPDSFKTTSHVDFAIDLLLLPDILPIDQQKSLYILGLASRLYNQIPGTPVCLSIVSQDLSKVRWFSPDFHPGNMPRKPSTGPAPLSEQHYDELLMSTSFSLSQTFSCLLMFETGTTNIDANALSSVMAMSAGNSIFVATKFLSDPASFLPQYHVRRIVGNVGRPGITLMVAPQNPRVRGPSEDWRQVRHAKYDFKRENNFQGTTLHLSFTDWKLPLESDSSGTVDKDVFLVESVVSVHDKGEWVADIDILKAASYISVFECGCTGQEIHTSDSSSAQPITIDNWDELIDSPHGIGIFRAQGNWAARLAAASILTRRNIESREKYSFFVCSTAAPCIQCASSGRVKILID